jgi:hypothetical protein
MDVLIGWPGGDWQATARLVAALAIGYFLLVWFSTVLWAYRDMRARTRDPVSQAVGVGIVAGLPLVGIPLYLIVRPRESLRDVYDRQLEQEAILSELHSASSCPNCRRPVQDDFMVCPHCRTALKEPCESCGRLLVHAWRNCPYCATPRREPVATATRPPERFDAGEPPRMPPSRRPARHAAETATEVEESAPVGTMRRRAAAEDADGL